ncbi:MAG: hypothetical protein AAB366_01655 [Patescibacteria group bacterium]
MSKAFRKFLKFFAIFSLIAVLGFSDIISFLPQILQNNKLAENLEVKEAQAAASIRATGTYVNGTANLTPVIPAGAVAGDMMLLAYGTKPYNDAPTITAGWTSIGSATDGTVAAGTDVGSMQTRIYYKEHDGSETNPTVTNTTNNVSGAVIIVFQKGATETWATPVGAGGGDNSAGTGFSVTAASDPGITIGDMIVGYAAIRSDAGTQTGIGITATGATIGAFTESPAADLATTAGGDMAMSGGYSLVTAGTASAAPVYASTLAASHTGSAFIVRLRPIPNASPTLTVTQPDGTGDTVTAGDLYNITYDLADTDNVVTAAMYYDTDATGLNGTAITGACATAAEGTGATCSWDTTGMTPNSYYVYGTSTDGINPQVSDYSSGVITINAPANNLTIGVTAGSKTTTVNSGDISVYANDISCSASSTCAALTLNVSNTSVTVSSIKITEIGTANATADLSQLALFYDTDGNYSNGVTGQYGATVASFTSEAATVSGSLALTAATTYYFYARFNASSTAPSYPKGGQTVDFQIAANADVTLSSGTATISGAPVSLAGTTAILPRLTSVTYGTGLSDGARSSEAITISGYGFGVVPGGSRANCAGAVDTGCVRFIVGGNDTVADASVTAWSNTSIGWTVSSTLATLGGASSLEVVSGSQGTGTDTTYYIYPRVNGMTTCSAGGDRDNACGTNQSQEYAAADTFGLIRLNGDHFGASAGTITFTGGITFTIHNTAEGACAVAGWATDGTSVCAEVSTAIASSTNSGTITLNRTDSKTDTIALELLPRITSATPTSGVVGDVITIDGDHFCQSAGGCPASPPTTDYKVLFGNTEAIAADFTATGNCAAQGISWSDSRICVKVPSGTPVGTQKIKVVKKATPNQESERENFTVNSTVPNTPTNLEQKKTDIITAIDVNTGTNQSSVVFEGDISAGVSVTMWLEVEVRATSTAFDGTVTASSSAFTGASFANVTSTVSGLTNGAEYHWRARTKNSVGESSAWTAFGNNPSGDGTGDGSPANRDFYIDTSAPTISIGTPPSSCTAHSAVTDQTATISWTAGGEILNTALTTNQTRYGTDSTLVSGNTVSASAGLSPSANLTGLNAGTPYYYWVKSTDAVGNFTQNPSGSPFCSFTTSAAVTRIMKSVDYFIVQRDQITDTQTSSSTFTLYIAETSSTLKNAYVEIDGVIIGTGGSVPTFQVGVNGQTSLTVDLPNTTSPQPFKIHYNLPSLTLNCSSPVESQNGICANGTGANKILFTFGGGFSKASLVNAKMVITYFYTP